MLPPTEGDSATSRLRARNGLSGGANARKRRAEVREAELQAQRKRDRKRFGPSPLDRANMRERGISEEADTRLVAEIVKRRAQPGERRAWEEIAAECNRDRRPKTLFEESEVNRLAKRAYERFKRPPGGLNHGALAARGITRNDIDAFMTRVIAAHEHGLKRSWRSTPPPATRIVPRTLRSPMGRRACFRERRKSDSAVA